MYTINGEKIYGEMQQWILEEVDDVFKLPEQDLVLEAPTEEDVLESKNLSQQQAMVSDVD